MRLKQIKLAGFKSFVDPTKVPFVQQMTAIVGPNGCGKSNIIDAVRWVLGESSAKNLRGDSMTDVIFNGAASRKPIGQASVELIFEHSDNAVSPALTKHLAERSEISIRRVVNRESINTYYLNGSKCRRKDITDIFLGTGLGPRSYAIIEQGTIARLIESKPQELRVFIEEAAGISKYKERRRDTENRIRHTRENLERLSDIRFELGQQIEKLDQQAQAAKRFRTLKAQERKYKAELAVLRSQKYQAQAKVEQESIIKIQNEIEQLVVEQISCERQVTEIKTANSDQATQLEHLQVAKVEGTSQCVRLEQNIKHAKTRLQVLTQEQAKHHRQFQQLDEQLKNDFASQLTHEKTIELKKPLLAQEEHNLDLLSKEVATLKAENIKLQHSVKSQTEKAKEQLVKRSTLVSKIAHQKQQIESLNSRKLNIKQQADNLKLEKQSTEIKQEKLELENLVAVEKELKKAHLATEQTFTKQKQNYEQVNQALNEKNWQFKHLNEQVELLSTELTASLNDDQRTEQLNRWLLASGIQTSGAFFERIKVSDKWLVAVERVLGHIVQSTITEDSLANIVAPVATNFINIVIKSSEPGIVEADTLASVIEGIEYYPSLLVTLNQVKLASSFEEAKVLQSQLTNGKSAICPDGVWISASFISAGNLKSTDNVLEKQAKLSKLSENKTHMNDDVLVLQSKLVELEVSLTTTKLSYQQSEQEYNNHLKKRQQNQQLHALNSQSYTHNVELNKQNEQQLSSLQEQADLAQDDLEELLYESVLLEDEEQIDLAELDTKTRRSNEEIAQKQQQLIEQQQAYHQHKLSLETALTSQQSIVLHKSRIEEQIHHIESQLETLGFEEENLKGPLNDDEKALIKANEKLFELERNLIAHQKLLTGDAEHIASIDKKKSAILTKIDNFKASLNKHNIHLQNYQLRAETALEGISEIQSIKDVTQNMPSEAKESLWQANLTRLAKDIAQLGAINLAAIEEFDTQHARKLYLDQQDEDLNQALKTLESAIAKIDKESRAKFKSTFEQVNQGLQQLFPKVFGGGSAYLALTGDDLLETGVTIMARPPGKKNSTIHLLSGGEKALTALSLVFAIFRLNPAPFCMLDEVDAPLDDANVGRFCNLVREMSQTVQFIYISHNKIAMEMASQLTGVTMYEPGVSRMVAVDIDEAVAMAELS